MTKRRLIKVAKEAYLHAGEYAFTGRKNKKRDMRALWISRISQAVQDRGLSYSLFINKMKAANINLDRKMLAILVSDYPDIFEQLVEDVKTVN